MAFFVLDLDSVGIGLRYFFILGRWMGGFCNEL